jgi:hypothetical protein
MALFHRFSRWSKAAGACLAVLAIALYCGIPRKANLRAFDPAKMAVLETAMWRDYYDKRYADLFFNLYLPLRDELDFSPLDSLKIALAAANAARTFQPTRSRDEANAVLPALVRYYGLLARATPARFDVSQAARLELDWWPGPPRGRAARGLWQDDRGDLGDPLRQERRTDAAVRIERAQGDRVP